MQAVGMAGSAAITALIEQAERTGLLRLSTAGSVDDGKSTLIGRLLYDSNGVYEDQLASVRQSSINRSSGAFDLALLTDGLRAEREQGITIDVAYRYFSTPKRKFIIADTPGHEQYTRNMATGASTANLALILVDARKGVLPQSRRHAFIASMLGIQHIVMVVNKMDLVGYSQKVFDEVCAEFQDYASRLQAPDLHFIPISALNGDNVVEKSRNMPWFDGASLLHYLETVHIASDRNLTEFRFPVQHVLRPDLNFRGYAGTVASGVIKPGDPVMILPGGRTSRVKSIVSYDAALDSAYPPMSVALCLEDEIDISRGDMLVPPSHPPHSATCIDARVVWMHDRNLEIGRGYLLKHTTQTVRATVSALRYRMNVNTLEKETGSGLGLNDIGAVVIETHKPIFCDPYRRNRVTGSFILIDPMTNATVAAGMITGREPAFRQSPPAPETAAWSLQIAGPAAQASHSARRRPTLWLDTPGDLAYQLEGALLLAGCRAVAIQARESVAEVCRSLNDAGFLALVYGATDSRQCEDAQKYLGSKNFLHLEGSTSVAHVFETLKETNLIAEFPNPGEQPLTHRGFTLWLTGLSGAGKSTLSALLTRRLRAHSVKLETLDGDEVRTHLSKGLGYSKEDRDENVRRIGYVCELLSRNGVIAIAAAISPYRSVREELRSRIPNFVEVYVECPIDVLAERDVKGLYKKALSGEFPHFTGVSDPYEPPLNPEVVVNSATETPDQSIEKILAKLSDLGLISIPSVSRGRTECRP